jgi:hypothetical protein
MKGKELNMNLTVYNPQKSRLETIEVEFKADNTTWFNGGKAGDVLMITDYNDGLLIRKDDHDYPVFVYGLSRTAIGYSREKAKQILQEHE